MEHEEFENLKKLYPRVECVDTAFIVQDNSDLKFDVRLWDEISECSDDELERTGFDTWEEAESYLQRLYDEHQEVYFIRDYDLDTFCD